ncbi:isoprenoid synthase domain-containing protein [Favolaschia claudopus]|uniref:Terpene synthase n=1 Tax=Favolaschia claudopus TaxID=2862362 RepID=A0AAW0AJI0_9AGAR
MDKPIYHLPHTLRNWPWGQSVAWLESFHPFFPQVQHVFNKCDFSLLSALTFPKASLYDLRSCCDLMHTFFTLDEYTDLRGPSDVKTLCDATMDAIENPDKPRPEGENIIGEIARQFWRRASVDVPRPCQERFVNSWRTYLDSVVEQAERRSKSYICTMNEYLAARRNNIGSEPSFVFLEISLQLDLPHEVMEHPLIVALNATPPTCSSCPTYDMCSYKKEVLANDAAYNAVTVVMVNEHTDIAGGIQWISDYHDEIVERFLRVREDVINQNGFPSWGTDIDDQVAKYIDGLGNVTSLPSHRVAYSLWYIGQWIRGHDEWNFGSGRYFGDRGLEVQKTRVVAIV